MRPNCHDTAYNLPPTIMPVDRIGFGLGRWLCAATAATWLCSLLLMKPAHADGAEVKARLDWRRGPGALACLDGQWLAREVERRLHRKVFVQDDAAEPVQITVRGRVESSPEHGGLVARLQLESVDGSTIGTREIRAEGPDCASLEDGLPIVVALMVNLPRESVVLDLTAPGRPKAAPKSAADPAALSVATAATSHSRRWGWTLGAGFAGGLGLLPGTVLGSEARVGVEMPPVPEIRLATTFWAPSVHLDGAQGSLIWAWEIAAALCPDLVARSRLRAGACAQGGFGRFHSRGVGFERVFDGEGSLAHLGATGWIELALGGPWWMAVDLTAATPLVRHSLVFQQDASEKVLFRAPPVNGRAALAVILRVPSF